VIRGDGTTPILAGTLNGAAVLGRAGSMKTSILFNGNLTDNLEAQFYIEVACPAGFTTPASNSIVFDYSQLFPVASAKILASGVNTGGEWPVSIDDFLVWGQVAESMDLLARLFASTPPSAAHPYGSLTYEFYGEANDTIQGALVSATIDFGHSISN
jgi:hypothetical protein